MIPKISILIPAYEDGKRLERLLRSIEEQTEKDYQVIISDDSESDDCKKVARKFSNRMALTYLPHKRGKTAVANWNNLLRYAPGKIIKFMHQDDWFAEPESLKKMVDLLEESGCSFAFSGWKLVNASNYVYGFISPEQERNLRENIDNLFWATALELQVIRFFTKMKCYLMKRCAGQSTSTFICSTCTVDLVLR